MIKGNIEHRHFSSFVDKEVDFEDSWSLNVTTVMKKNSEKKDNRPAPKLSSVLSIPGDSVTYSNAEQETKPRPSDIGGGSKGKSKTETKTPRKRGRPKGKKTTSHPVLKRPKRPLSGYNIFFKDQREQIVGKAGKPAGTLKFAELARTIGARWKALDESARRMYESRGAAEMKIYKVVMEEYNRKVKELNDSENSRSTDADNVIVSDLSSTHEDSSFIKGEVENHQADATTSMKASTILENNDDMNLDDAHKNHCTNQAQVTQSLSQVATLDDINHLLPSPTTEIAALPSIKKQLDEVYTTTVSSSDVTSSEIETSERQTTNANGSDTSEFTFDCIEDVLGIDTDTNDVPDARFLVFSTEF